MHTAFNNKYSYFMQKKNKKKYKDKGMQDALKQNIVETQGRHEAYKNSPKTAQMTLKLNNVQVYFRWRPNGNHSFFTAGHTYIYFSFNECCLLSNSPSLKWKKNKTPVNASGSGLKKETFILSGWNGSKGK